MAGRTNIELTNMVLCYGQAMQNARQARIIYIENYFNANDGHPPPSEQSFVRAVQNLRDRGRFNAFVDDRGRARGHETVALEEQILDAVEENPRIGTRRLTAQLGQMSNFVTWRTIHENSLYPYHLQKVQALQNGDNALRLEFCHWYLQKTQEDAEWSRGVLFTDEATFTRDGIFNQHNTHVWAFENPHEVRECHHQQQFSLNVWAGIVANNLIGPHILPQRLNGQMYLDFLQNDLPDLLFEVPLAVWRRIWYQHDGAPAHFARNVTDHLNETFPARWIGRNGPIRWPPRSPDLNPCDFYLWGAMKQIVYREPVNNLAELSERVWAAAQELLNSPDIFIRVRENMLRRVQACILNNGNHFEHLL